MYTNNTDISAGDTPEIRDACPIEIGRTVLIFELPQFEDSLSHHN